MFSPSQNALDLNSRLRFNRLVQSPFQLGTWSILEPAGSQNHAPQLCWLSSNQLGCVWMAGSGEGTAGMSIVMSFLRRESRCWSKPRKISQDNSRSEQNPLLFLSEAETGEYDLQLIHTAQKVRTPGESRAESGSFSMQWTASLKSQRRSQHKGRWSKAIDLLDTPAFCRHPPHRREDGKWLLPIYRSLESGGAFGHDYSEILILEANGKSTRETITIPNSTGRVHGSLVPSADKQELLQFFRSRQADRIYRSRGSIDGQIWTVPEAIELPNNNSSIQALRLQSGLLAMLFNRFCIHREPITDQYWGEAAWPRTRWPMSIALSNDDGETWPWIRDIDHGDGFNGSANWHLNGQLAYPSIVEGLPGELHIAYSWAGRQAIRYVCLTEEQILGLAR